MQEDTYNTIHEPSRGLFKQQGSRFVSFAYPVSDVQRVGELVKVIRDEYHDARHWCYAYRIGLQGQISRSSDDGEPSGTAARPILGQLLSRELTNVLVVVVRYFGGIKLGVSGLIGAYRAATVDALDQARVIECTRKALITVNFPYLSIDQAMKAIKDSSAQILSQEFDNACAVTLQIRQKNESQLLKQLQNIDQNQIIHQGYDIP